MTRAAAPEIVSQTFGDPGDPTVLLIMGAMASMLWWPEALCKKLAGEGRFVIRYDNRRPNMRRASRRIRSTTWRTMRCASSTVAASARRM